MVKHLQDLMFLTAWFHFDKYIAGFARLLRTVGALHCSLIGVYLLQLAPLNVAWFLKVLKAIHLEAGSFSFRVSVKEIEKCLGRLWRLPCYPGLHEALLCDCAHR